MGRVLPSVLPLDGSMDRLVPATTPCTVPHLDCNGWMMPSSLDFWGARGSHCPQRQTRPSALLALSLSRQPSGCAFCPASQQCGVVHPSITVGISPPHLSSQVRDDPGCSQWSPARVHCHGGEPHGCPISARGPGTTSAPRGTVPFCPSVRSPALPHHPITTASFKILPPECCRGLSTHQGWKDTIAFCSFCIEDGGGPR